MMKEKDFINSNAKSIARAGTVMTPYSAQKLLEIDRKKYSHLLMVMDTFDYETYSVAVPTGKLMEYIVKYNQNMQRVYEAVILEETSDTIKNYLKHNTPESFYDIDGREA
jgi:hypothetical protein